MEVKSPILHPGVVVVCPPAVPYLILILKHLKSGSAKVVVLHSYHRKLSPVEAFGIHQSITLRHLARMGDGFTIKALIKGLFFYWSRILQLQNEVCAIVAFDNANMYSLEKIQQSIEAVWNENDRPAWTVEFLTGDMENIYKTFFPKEEIPKMERVARSMQELN